MRGSSACCGRSQESYCETLEASSQRWHEGEHDVHPWLDHFWGTRTRAYRAFEERVGTLAGGRGSKRAHVARAARRRTLPFATPELQRDRPGVSRETIRQVLRELRDAGALELRRKGRGARWWPTHRDESE